MTAPACVAEAPAHAAPAAHAARVPYDQASRLRALVGAAERPRQEVATVRPPTGPQPPAPRRVRGARIVTVASGKGGVGKTSLCVNACIAMAQAGYRVTLLDADHGMANADLMCGLSPARRLERVIGLSESGTPDSALAASMADIAVEAPGGFRLIPGSVGVARMADLSALERDRLIDGLAAVEADSDVIVVDAAAGVGQGVLSVLAAADLGVIVATPEPTSVTDAYALVKCSLASTRREAGGEGASSALCLVVNQASNEAEAFNVHARIANTCARFLSYNLPFLGWVAQDVRVGVAVRRRRPLLLDNPKCQAGKDLRSLSVSLARRLALGDPRPRIPGLPGGLRGVLSRLAGGAGGSSR